MLRISGIATRVIILLQIYGYNYAYECPVVSFNKPSNYFYVNANQANTIKVYYEADCQKIRELYSYWKRGTYSLCYFNSVDMKISNYIYFPKSAGNMKLNRVTSNYLEFKYNLNSNIYDDFSISLKIEYTMSCKSVTFKSCKWYEHCPTHDKKHIKAIAKGYRGEENVDIDVKNLNVKYSPPESQPETEPREEEEEKQVDLQPEKKEKEEEEESVSEYQRDEKEKKDKDENVAETERIYEKEENDNQESNEKRNEEEEEPEPNDAILIIVVIIIMLMITFLVVLVIVLVRRCMKC